MFFDGTRLVAVYLRFFDMQEPFCRPCFSYTSTSILLQAVSNLLTTVATQTHFIVPYQTTEML